MSPEEGAPMLYGGESGDADEGPDARMHLDGLRGAEEPDRST